MNGKSSFSRSVALIALMAQVGCYVPADSCTTSLFDNILTRMGASDEIARGRSTFMVEMSECSEILKLASPRSLIILDELGRGTSTSDGQVSFTLGDRHVARHLRALVSSTGGRKCCSSAYRHVRRRLDHLRYALSQSC